MNTNLQELSPQNNFYNWVNNKWLNDPSNAIPVDQTSWGGFIKLREEGIQKQIQIAKDISQKDTNFMNHDEMTIKSIWNAALNQYRNGSDYSSLATEFMILENHSIFNNDFLRNYANYMYHCSRCGISNVLNFDKCADPKSSDDSLLDISYSGLSLPSREYYLDSNYSSYRDHYKAHLNNIRVLLTNNNFTLPDSFVNDVFEFETRLAKIRMTKSQTRDFVKYYTVTTLSNVYEKVNELAEHPDKYKNYALSDTDSSSNSEVNVEDNSKKCCYQVSEDEKGDMKAFMETLYDVFDFRSILHKNYRLNYENANDLSIDKIERLTVYDGDYMRRIVKVLCDSKDILKSYLLYKIIVSQSSFCSKELNNEIFDFYSRKLNGQVEQKSPEKRAISLIESWVGELMGKIFVKKYFPESSKRNVLEMISTVIKAMKNSILENDWLMESTKAKALEKLSKFTVKIGYPDEWEDFSILELLPNETMHQMYLKVADFDWSTKFIKKLNAKVDKKEWHMTPQTVNAYFNASLNEIVFPAAILQPPFYYSKDGEAKDVIAKDVVDSFFDVVDVELNEEERNIDFISAINYGGIGAVIAHEITHGYDDNGSKFDGDGNLNNWWTDEDKLLFETKTKLMEEHAEMYVFNDIQDDGSVKAYNMNAHLTTGENLADLGGLNLSMRAMLNSIGEGETHKNEYLRVFFKSWANVWKCNMRKEMMIKNLTTDPHAPKEFRGNMVKHIDNFYDCFNVKEGDSMYVSPNKRVKIW